MPAENNKKSTIYDFGILVILDGWGIAPEGPGNAISKANLPNYHRFLDTYPNSTLEASGRSVGLPQGEAGNTETGHINIGAGKIIYQDLARINMSIAEGTFFENDALRGAISHARESDSYLNLLGLIGAGGVHSSLEHLFALIQLASRENFDKVKLHLITDGRDSSPTSAIEYIQKVQEVIQREKVGRIASIMGRYWAMDRDRRWDRTEKAYNAIVKGKAKTAKTAKEVIENSYKAGVTDEFIFPTLIINDDINESLIKDNDSVIFFNFRIDRPRQLSKALISDQQKIEDKHWDFDPHAIKYEKTHIPEYKPSSKSFNRGEKLKNLYFVMMTEYSKALVESGANVAFPPEKIEDPLSEIVSTQGYKQLKIAESEKERFVTYYFNGQRDKSYPNEDWVIIPSPKVTTYDKKPEMSAYQITDTLLEKLKKEKYFLTVVNYANPDMVGHTGNIGPCVKALEVVDECIGRLSRYVLQNNGFMLITADHGNAEQMISLKDGKVDTEHSTNPVPIILISDYLEGKRGILQEGILADVAPTLLNLLGLTAPDKMTGRNLLG
ncbi:2,3-bisphosphoglycerate-independent phosphoglycerate mutase [Candidatus Woesebacteria bacterium]|nr:2,3-bisphosphoglycerate-independent phosphoglycerate mutase [Candidatus Woesebacteria bacterium]